MAVGGWRMRRLLTGALLLLGGLCSTHADDQQEVWLVELLPRVHAAQLPAWPTTRVTSRAERREQVAAFLQATVKPTQRHAERVLRRYAEELNAADAVTVERLWIQNTLLVRWRRGRGDAQTTMKRLQWLPGVHSVERDAPSGLSLLPVTTDNEEEEGRHRADQREAVQTNVRLVHAPEVWDQVKARGDGVTVASIDSGVRYTHEALATTFRGYRGASNVTFDYSFWFKPGTDPSKETPDTADEVGHGTHTVGTAVGGRGIGVAPGATWIAARAFDIHGAVSHSDFLLATQWALCPTKVDGSAKNCSLGADVITGSFGVDRSDVATFKQWTWLTHALQVWRSAGSYAVFASGNANGFKCGSVFYPASRPESVAVGALIGGSTLWGASGKGPGADDESDGGDVVKPDFVAPGAAIRSALSTGDSAYTRMTGTSMAAPHLTGLIALLLSIQQPHNKPGDVVKVLQETASHGLSKPFLVPSTCGGTRYDQYPNNIYGSGLPNVCDAATKAFSVACHSTKTAMDTVVSVE